MSPERKETAGFTLIEVLVALAIIALGLVGVFGQMSQSATAAIRLRDKTLADWVAMNAITELRLKGEFPAIGTRSDDVDMANTKWHYEMKISDTGSDLRRLDVTVTRGDDRDRPLAAASGFVILKQKNPPVTATGWPPCNPEGVQGENGPPANNPPPPPPPAQKNPPPSGSGGVSK